MTIVYRHALDTLRLFMLVEAASFTAGSLVHSGVFITGYEHEEARLAEGVIAAMLFVGLILTWILPPWAREVGLLAQAFALLGTLVGIFTIAIGIGPRAVPDLVYHATIVVVLVVGLTFTARIHSQTADQHA